MAKEYERVHLPLDRTLAWHYVKCELSTQNKSWQVWIDNKTPSQNSTGTLNLDSSLQGVNNVAIITGQNSAFFIDNLKVSIPPNY